MLEAPEIRRTASAMRTALVGRPTIRFDSPSLAGPAPCPGRLVERIDARGRELDVTWDDGLILHTTVRRGGTWHLYRVGESWRRPEREVNVTVETDDWVAVCYNASTVETFRTGVDSRHPSMGRVGPDITDIRSDLSSVVESMANYRDPAARVRDVLLDARVVRNVGNVVAAEAMWASRLSPWARIGDLPRSDAIMLVNTAARSLRSRLSTRVLDGEAFDDLEVYGRNGQGCSRCGDTIEVLRFSSDGRFVYYCPGCQTRLDHRLLDDTPVMDPHPAAAKFLADLADSADD